MNKKITKLALLTAMSLGLFTLELQLPPITPLPGVKIGLANIITLYMLYTRSFTSSDAAMTVTARVLLAWLIIGSPTTLLYSLSGGITAVGAMTLLRKAKLPPPITSVGGALVHNVTQVAVAMFIYGGKGMLLYLPMLILAAISSGLLTGFVITIVRKWGKYGI